MRHQPKRPLDGFTLVELLVVMAIIGILFALILNAASGGLREAQSRATQSTIVKLETALSDRIESLLNTRVDPLQAHFDLAQIYGGSPSVPLFPNAAVARRAQVIATFDYLKNEVPDVYCVGGPGGFPINCAAMPYPPTGTNYALPLGAGPGGYGYDVTGFSGASFPIWAQFGTLNINAVTFVKVNPGINLALHTHKTARAEMLYAVLVGGQGPYGSVVDRDDFTDKEVADTDGDGLPEFIDGWGEPLQFYRWPTFYHTDQQRGLMMPGPYSGAFDSREQNPLDPNQQLMAPAWWSAGSNSPPGIFFTADPGGVISGTAFAFQQYFTQLTEPMAGVSGANTMNFWDRSASLSGSLYGARRAFYSRFLIVSSGPDKNLGIFQLSKDYKAKYNFIARGYDFSATDIVPPFTGIPAKDTPFLMVESLASQAQLVNPKPAFALDTSNPTYLSPKGFYFNGVSYGNSSEALVSQMLVDFGQDDISNQGLQSAGGFTQ